MKKLTMLLSLVLITVISASSVWGKDIIEDAKTLKGVNKAYIRADGLACYFCAYGLERFFRKSGKVAAYDMNMKEGVVEITFIKGKPLMVVGELHQIVYDAGYTPRETSYELVGKLEKSGVEYLFHPEGTGQSFPFKSVSALTIDPAKLIGKTVTLKTRAEKYQGNSMALQPISIETAN
ncbi:hypothetical protein MNBD_NITROSPINAE02-1282 [hydrothermal vent metagenome]|uniref:Uncharacterized protein n=1 Tax=hydrothermal vent metagenome TaxID=652676 RepID=A0A3B1CB61_9ZZZZ